MNGTGALRQFVPRSLGIAPGRPLAIGQRQSLTIRDAEIFKDHAGAVTDAEREHWMRAWPRLHDHAPEPARSVEVSGRKARDRIRRCPRRSLRRGVIVGG